MIDCAVQVGDLLVSVRDHLGRDGFSGAFCAADQVLVNMALTPRPALLQGWLEPPGGARQWAALGELFVVPPGVAFGGHAPDGVVQPYLHRSLSCVMPRRLFDALVPDGSLWLDALFGRCMDLRCPPAMQSLHRMSHELLEPEGASPVALKGLADVLAVDVSRVLRAQAREVAPLGGLPVWRKQAIDARLHDEALRPPSVAELAQCVGLSERQLMRAFRQQRGVSLGQYVRDVTIERSKRLLAAQSLTVKEIAATLGFAGAASFSHAFHQATGQRPSDYQRMCRQWVGAASHDPAGNK